LGVIAKKFKSSKQIPACQQDFPCSFFARAKLTKPKHKNKNIQEQNRFWLLIKAESHKIL
jgi:hypothetical protein